VSHTRLGPPLARDLRRGRPPEIEILACEVYDLLLSVHIVLASPDYSYADYDIGTEWIERARARANAKDPQALERLGRVLGDDRPHSLSGTLLSLVRLAPEPRTTASFIKWLRAIEPHLLIEALLDQDGLGLDWHDLMIKALAEVMDPATPGVALRQLLERYPPEMRPHVEGILRNPATIRREIADALAVWDKAVFSHERAKVNEAEQRDAELLNTRRQELASEPFVEETMRGVQWQRPASLRRIVFAPSYFCGPAVFYHFAHGTLTFCIPIEREVLHPGEVRHDPRQPSEEMLQFFLTLGDESRLRILGLLAGGEKYLTELADEVGLTKATTKHHMVKLRAAGLVNLIVRDRLTYYALRPDIATHAAQALEQFLTAAARHAAKA
jgi:DNA-binding transcriptional ArsR family regulator